MNGLQKGVLVAGGLGIVGAIAGRALLRKSRLLFVPREVGYRYRRVARIGPSLAAAARRCRGTRYNLRGQKASSAQPRMSFGVMGVKSWASLRRPRSEPGSIPGESGGRSLGGRGRAD